MPKNFLYVSKEFMAPWYTLRFSESGHDSDFGASNAHKATVMHVLVFDSYQFWRLL